MSEATGPLAALAGFVAPGAAKALELFGPEVAEAIAAETAAVASEVVPDVAAEVALVTVAETAAAGLFGSAVLPVGLALLYPWAISKLVSALSQPSVAAGGSKADGGWVLRASCPQYPADHGTRGSAVGAFPTCAQMGANNLSMTLEQWNADQTPRSTDTLYSYVTEWARTGTFNVSVFYHVGEVWFRTSTDAHNPSKTAVPPHATEPPVFIPGRVVLSPGLDDIAPFLDPLSPPGAVPFLRPPLPYRLLPARERNPHRSPSEQTQRGLEVPPGAGAVVIGPDEVEVPVRAPDIGGGDYQPPWQWPDVVTPTAPGQDPGTAPDTGPGEAPGPVPGPAGPGEAPSGAPPVGVLEPSQGTDEPPVRQEVPEGSFGPTITIGGGPPVGPHLRQPPRKREKERKGRYVNPGTMFLLKHGANPLTEALEVLDCLYKSLPKKVRWKTQQSSWRRQQRIAKEKGYRLESKPNPIHANGPKIDLPFLPGNQSISLPGGQPRFNDVDLSKHYYTGLSPQEKAVAVYTHANELDLASAASCWAANEVEDRIFGGIGRLSAKGARKIRRPVGLQTGPLF